MSCFNCAPNRQCDIAEYYDTYEEASSDLDGGCDNDGMYINPETCECFEEDV
jgi:hypothetical protein